MLMLRQKFKFFDMIEDEPIAQLEQCRDGQPQNCNFELQPGHPLGSSNNRAD